MQDAWQMGGRGELFRDLTWPNRPAMTGSEASEDLQRAWVATIMAIHQVQSALRCAEKLKEWAADCSNQPPRASSANLVAPRPGQDVLMILSLPNI